MKEFFQEPTSYEEIQKIITNQSTSFDIVNYKEKINGAANPKIYGKRSDYITLTEEDIVHNAMVIKSTIDRNLIPLISIDSDELFKLLNGSFTSETRSHNPRHAVCIAGYKISEGKMSVLLLESNIGPIWLPLEFLSQITLANAKTFVASNVS